MAGFINMTTRPFVLMSLHCVIQELLRSIWYTNERFHITFSRSWILNNFDKSPDLWWSWSLTQQVQRYTQRLLYSNLHRIWSLRAQYLGACSIILVTQQVYAITQESSDIPLLEFTNLLPGWSYTTRSSDYFNEHESYCTLCEFNESSQSKHHMADFWRLGFKLQPGTVDFNFLQQIMIFVLSILIFNPLVSTYISRVLMFTMKKSSPATSLATLCKFLVKEPPTLW